mgnify:CR=1 FL=1
MTTTNEIPRLQKFYRDHAVQALLKALGLRKIDLSDDWVERELLVGAREFGALPRPVRSLLDHLLDRARALGATGQVRLALVEDLRQHLSELVSEGFVARSPDPWLEGFVRYLKALRRRLAKLPSMRGAVADAQYEYLEARKRLRVAKQRAKEAGAETRLQAWRWHLEEYAVQLFAQDLRTRVPVSAKRLALLEAEAEAALRHP